MNYTQKVKSESNVEEDDELERLRSEALNARRAKNSNIFLNKEELRKSKCLLVELINIYIQRSI